MAKIIFIAIAIAGLTGLAGCSGMQRAPVNGIDQVLADQPLICEGASQCSDMWRRAQFYVAQNAGYKIQTATDVVIQTYNPPDYSTTWAYKLTREPLGGGRERIWVAASCGQFGICRDDKVTMIARAKGYLVQTLP